MSSHKGAQGRIETDGYEDDNYSSAKKSSSYYDKVEDNIGYGQKKDDIYSGTNKYEENFEDTAEPLYEDYSHSEVKDLLI